MTQPVGSMNQPVPVSRKAGGVTVCGPPPQFSVTSAETSEIMSTVAGLARSTVSWTESGCWAWAWSVQTTPAMSPRASGITNRRIIGIPSAHSIP